MILRARLRTPAAERTVGAQPETVRDAVRRNAAQDRRIGPDAELDLDGADLRDAPRFFDLPDGDITETDCVNQAIALQRGERPDARREWRARIGRVQLIERD